MIGRATQANGIRYFRKCAAKTAALGERETSLGLENVPLGARGVSTPLGQNDARDGRSSQRPTSRICRRFMSSSIAVSLLTSLHWRSAGQTSDEARHRHGARVRPGTCHACGAGRNRLIVRVRTRGGAR